MRFLQQFFGMTLAACMLAAASTAGVARDEPSAATGGSSAPTTLAAGESCVSAGCHTGLGQEKKYVHAGVADGLGCNDCHDMADATRHVFTLPTKKGEVCIRCHENTAGGENLHGPFAEAKCLRCHTPHASEFKKLTKEEQPELCFDCHNRPVKDNDGKYLPAVKPLFDNDAVMLHKPVKKGRCSTCHRAHASPNHRLLKKPYPASFYSSYAKKAYFCIGCHKKKAFEEARTLTATGFRNGNLNLHYRHVNRDKGRTCRACHHHHGSPNEKLIRNSVPFGERFITIENFELTETGGTCGPTCHTQVSYDRLNPVDNGLKVTPREGQDATPGELAAAGQE